MPMFVKMGNGGTGYLSQKSSFQRAAERRARRRKVAQGFPWDGKFETREQVEKYFSGDKIECLLCGRTMKKLGAHLIRIHGVSDDQYKARYGLPWSRGLVCNETFDRYSKAITEAPERVAHMKRLAAEYQHLVVGASHRSMPPYMKTEAAKRCVENMTVLHHDRDQETGRFKRVYGGRSDI